MDKNEELLEYESPKINIIYLEEVGIITTSCSSPDVESQCTQGDEL